MNRITNSPLEGLVRVEGNVSRQFERSIEQTLALLPNQVSRLAADAGSQIIVVPSVVEYFPHLKNIRPRGWRVGATWSNADGLHLFDLSNNCDKIVIAQTNISVYTGHLAESPRSRGVLLHEFGHTVDHLLGFFSRSPEFVAAYLKDASKIINGPLEGKLAYYFQGYELKRGPGLNAAGLKEAFADVFAALHGSSANYSETRLVLTMFSTVATVIRRRLKTI